MNCFDTLWLHQWKHGACDVIFGTNDKVLSPIFLQCFIFSKSTWPSQLISFMLVAILVVYVHGIEWVAKWSSHGLDHIHSKQKCECLAMVDRVEGQTSTLSS